MTGPQQIGERADDKVWVTVNDAGVYVEHRRYADGSMTHVAISKQRLDFLRTCDNWTFVDQKPDPAQGELL